MDPKKDIPADLNLADLFEKRAEAAKRQKETADKVQGAKADHFVGFWLVGGLMLLAAIWIAQELATDRPTGAFLLAASVILWLLLWVGAFFPTETVRRYQDEANAATRGLRDVDNKIAFCHQVLEEAKRIKVQTSARAWVEKESK
jgi:hypothetical protein